MGLPMRAYYTVQDVAIRWECGLDDLAGWAATGRIDIVTTIAPFMQDGRIYADFVVIPVTDLRGMFRCSTCGPARRPIRRFRVPGETDWIMIADPEDHIGVELADLLIMADEVHRFETEHGLSRRKGGDPGGAPVRYDWEGLFAMLIGRVHLEGIPATQAELIAIAQDWFAQNAPSGDVPDERTMRRRLSPIWRTLREEA